MKPNTDYVESVNQPTAEPTLRAGFWRRLAAAWVDLFLLYATASFLIEATGLVRVRLALEPTLLALGTIYGVVCLHQGGRTPGKLLFGIAVTAQSGAPPSWERILLREGLGKWLLLGSVPGIVGRLLLSTGWVPTIYDLLAVIPLILLTLVHYAFCRRTWYDQLAKTAVIRRPASLPMTRRAFGVLLCAAFLGAGVKVADQVSLGRLPSRTLLYYRMGSSQPYVDFLRRTAVSPKDYIFKLFERYDVVVLCERAHPEVTQWDFIFDLVSDPRFNQRIGHVFTELGQTGMQQYLDEFMGTDGLSDKEVDQRVLHIMRNWSVWPTWNRVNFPTYLKRLYALNQALPAAQRIRHHFTDGAVDWANLTREKMPDHWRALGNRDEKMAQEVIAGMQRLDKAGGAAKSLVVMNFRHAFDLRGGSAKVSRYNTFEFLRDGLNGRVANVRINENLFWPVDGGLWDVAFERNGNRPTGFDLAGSPFGKVPFDLFPWQPSVRGRLKYQDVFTGFVFLNPVRAQFLSEGIPGYYRGWEKEARRRAILFGPDYVQTVEQEIAREQHGLVPSREPHTVYQVESWFETIVAVMFGVGLGIGLLGFLFSARLQAPVPAPETRAALAGTGAARVSPKLWLLFAGAIVAALYVHEIGHCVVAWSHGCPAVPTPAKEYLLKPLPQGAQDQVALGGILGSVAALVGAIYWLYRKPDARRSALLAGAMAMPGFYVLRFILAGRGHDGAEFQQAQSAMSLSYNGHAADWLFVGLFALTAVAWFVRVHPRVSFRLAGRLMLGAVTALVVLVLVQSINNAVFDPLFR